MTPEERAEDILKRCWATDREDVVFKGLSVEIAHAVRAAVLDERAASATAVYAAQDARAEAAVLAASMTARERADKLHADCLRSVASPGAIDGKSVRQLMLEAIEAAVAEEREACAKVAESSRGASERWLMAAEDIARAIRARK